MSETATDIIMQSAALPWRERAGGLEVLIVSNRAGTRWWIPKGHIEDGLTPAESAAMEAWEEAGVIGETQDVAVGRFRYCKRKQTREVTIHPMKVERSFRCWPEWHRRDRQWVRAEAVEDHVAHPEIARAVQRLQLRLGIPVQVSQRVRRFVAA